MGKHGVDTGLHLGRVEDELRFAVFLRHRIVGEDSDLSVGFVVPCHAIAENSVVRGAGKYAQAKSR